MSYDATRAGGVDHEAEKAASLVRNLAKLFGAVFLLVGVLGFIPGIVTDYNTLQFAGEEGNAKLLGLFEISVLHNIVHILFGIAGLAMAKTAQSATTYLVGSGVIYAVLTLYGFVIDQNSAANFVPVNDADNLLHLVLAVALIGAGLVGGRALKGRVGAGRPA